MHKSAHVGICDFIEGLTVKVTAMHVNVINVLSILHFHSILLMKLFYFFLNEEETFRQILPIVLKYAH